MPDFFDIFIKFRSTTTYSKMAQMEAALAYLKGLEKPNYAAVAKQFNVVDTTLRRRHIGQTVSKQQHAEEHLQLLNKTQEDVLLGYIDRMTDKHIPPTTQIVRNLAEELLQKEVGKNWAAGFCKRHEDRISSVYLRPLDRARVAAEHPTYIEHFYALVLLISAFDWLRLTKI